MKKTQMDGEIIRDTITMAIGILNLFFDTLFSYWISGFSFGIALSFMALFLAKEIKKIKEEKK